VKRTKKSEPEFDDLMVQVLKAMNIEDESIITPTTSLPKGEARKPS